MGGRHATLETPPPHRDFKEEGCDALAVAQALRKKENRQPKALKKERKQTTQGAREAEGWEDGTPPPHRDVKERSVLTDGNGPPFYGSPWAWPLWG